MADDPITTTMAEAGYPGIGIRSWLGLLAPAHTPRPIVNRLHDEVAAVLSEPDFAKLLEERGMPANASTPEAFATVLRQETKSWKNLVSKLGLKLE